MIFINFKINKGKNRTTLFHHIFDKQYLAFYYNHNYKHNARQGIDIFPQ